MARGNSEHCDPRYVRKISSVCGFLREPGGGWIPDWRAHAATGIRVLAADSRESQPSGSR